MYPVPDEAAGRITKPAIPFYGKEILEMAIAGLLQGQNLLLAGPKATGKNILAENLAYIFHRPVYNVSFHVNTNSAVLHATRKQHHSLPYLFRPAHRIHRIPRNGKYFPFEV